MHTWTAPAQKGETTSNNSTLIFHSLSTRSGCRSLMGQERRNQSQRETRACNSPSQTSPTFTNSNPTAISTPYKHLLSVKAGCSQSRNQTLPFFPGNVGTGKTPLQNTAHGAGYGLLKSSVKPQHVPVEPGKPQILQNSSTAKCKSQPLLLGELGAPFSQGSSQSQPLLDRGCWKGQSQPRCPPHSGPKEQTQGMWGSKNSGDRSCR